PGRPTVVDAGERADRADVARDVLLAPGVPVHRAPAAVAVGDAPQHRASAPTPCAGRLRDQRLNLVPLSPIEERFPEHPGVALFVPDDLAPVGAVAHEVLSLQHVLEGLPPPLAALGFAAHADGVPVPRRHHALLLQVGGAVVQRVALAQDVPHGQHSLFGPLVDAEPVALWGLYGVVAEVVRSTAPPRVLPEACPGVAGTVLQLLQFLMTPAHPHGDLDLGGCAGVDPL